MKRRDLLKFAGFTAAGTAMIGGTGTAHAGATGAARSRDDVDLFVRDWGEGRPIVFVHSWALASQMWQYQMLPLTQAGYRCIAYDRRGHGQSPDTGGGYDFDTLADDLARVLEQRGLKGVTLVGHSMGAGEIARYIGRHGSARIAKIVIASPACTPLLFKRPDNPAGIDQAFFDKLRAGMIADFPKWVDDNADPFVVPATSPGMRAWIKGMFADVSLQAAFDCNRAMTTTDFRTDLKKIDRPTLVIHGTRDASAPLELTGRPTANAISGARLEIYEGAPHGLFATHIDRLTRDIRQFAEA